MGKRRWQRMIETSMNIVRQSEDGVHVRESEPNSSMTEEWEEQTRTRVHSTTQATHASNATTPNFLFLPQCVRFRSGTGAGPPESASEH